MPAVSFISVLMPIYQGAALLDRVLECLARQELAVPWELIAVDCGSTDGTLEILERRARGFPVPLRVHSIDRLEFNHGDTRNLLACLATSELLVFLTDDAIPVSRRWLATLAANFEDPRVGAAYCRNLPRPDADVLARSASERDPTYAPGRRETDLPPLEELARMSPHELRLLYNFSDTASALRRDLWRRHPYPRCRGAEDLLMARALLHAGYRVVYEDAAVVEHSHEYTPEQARARAFVDGELNAEWLGRVCLHAEGDVEHEVRAQLAIDRTALLAEGLVGEALEARLGEARELRRAHFEGVLEGGRSAERLVPPRVLESADLRILILCSGGEGGPIAAEEARARELGRSLSARGHECCIHTLDAAGDPDRLRSDFAALAGHLRPQVVHLVDLEAFRELLLHLDTWRWAPFSVRAPRADADASTRRALGLADLAWSADREASRAWLGREGQNPDRLVYAPAGDGPPDEVEVGQWESRLRALAARSVRLRSPRLLLQPAAGAVATEGRVRREGERALLLEAGSGASASFDLSRLPRGELDLRLHLLALPGEGEQVSCGRLLVDDRECGRIAAFTGGAIDRPRVLVHRLRLSEDASSLRVENAPGPDGAPAALRLDRVEWFDPGAPPSVVEPGTVLLDRTAREASRSGGDRIEQGIDLVLLGPGPGFLEFDLPPSSPASLRIEVFVAAAGGELRLRLAGQVWLDGRLVGRIPDSFAGERSELRAHRLVFAGRRPPRRLRLVSAARRGACHLRLQRVIVTAIDPPLSPPRAALRRLADRGRQVIGRPRRLLLS